MAAYCTLADLKERIPEEDIIGLTNDDETPTVYNSRVEAAITDASELIDGYLRGGYTLPLATVPGLIKNICIHLVLYALYSRHFVGDQNGLPETVVENYKIARVDLSNIQKGVIALDVGDETDSPAQNVFLTDKNNMEEFTDDIMDTF